MSSSFPSVWGFLNTHILEDSVLSSGFSFHTCFCELIHVWGITRKVQIQSSNPDPTFKRLSEITSNYLKLNISKTEFCNFPSKSTTPFVLYFSAKPITSVHFQSRKQWCHPWMTSWICLCRQYFCLHKDHYHPSLWIYHMGCHIHYSQTFSYALCLEYPLTPFTPLVFLLPLEQDYLGKWFSKCGLWTSSNSITWELVKIADTQVPPHTY